MLLAASFPKFGTPSFAWVALAPLIVAVVVRMREPHATAWAIVRLGLLTGAIFFAGTIYWTEEVMATFGGLGAPVALAVAALLVAYQALYVGLFAWLVSAAVRVLAMRGVWLAPFLWVAVERLRGWFLGGFPWNPLGNSQVTVLPIAQLASVTGVSGLSLLVAFVSAAAAAVTLSRKRAHALGAGAVLAAVVGVAAGGMSRLTDNGLDRAGDAMRVGIVQGNVPQEMKGERRYRDAIAERYLNLSRNAIMSGAQLVVWPEASTPFVFDRDPIMAAPVRKLAMETRTPFVIGTDEIEGRAIYNAAVLVEADGQSRQTYRKIHLVPFGEFVPFKKLLFFVGPLVEAVSDFAAGTDAAVLDAGNGARVGISICYESVYPSLSREFTLRGANLLLVITNDSWFGQSSAAYQHFDMGAMRAIENGRYLVRSGNTGISGIIDPYGRVTSRLDMFQPLATVGDVRLLTGRTIYTQTGDLAGLLSIAIAVTIAAAAWRHHRQDSISA